MGDENFLGSLLETANGLWNSVFGLPSNSGLDGFAALFIFTSICLCLFAGIWWARARAKRIDSQVRRSRSRDAAAGEARAVELLEAEGFIVLEHQPTQECSVHVNGQQFSFELRADLLAERDDKFFIIEVKTGDLVGSVSWAPTRRQLLEYSLAFPVDGVLLVDAVAETISEIEFRTEKVVQQPQYPLLQPAANNSRLAA